MFVLFRKNNKHRKCVQKLLEIIAKHLQKIVLLLSVRVLLGKAMVKEVTPILSLKTLKN
jgi:hypothetical protein